MKRLAAKALHLALVASLALGVTVLPSLTRCVDAAGHDAIELSNADCCVGAEGAPGLEHADACIGGCFDSRLVVPSLSRGSGAKDATSAPLALAPFGFDGGAPAAWRVRSFAAPWRSTRHGPHARLSSVLRC